MSAPPDAALAVPHYVYRCFDATGQLLYVGVTRDLGTRMFHHLHPCNIGKQPNGTLQRHMAEYTAELHPTKVAARIAERAAISTEAPLLNKQHNARRFRKNARSSYDALSPVHALTALAFDLNVEATA